MWFGKKMSTDKLKQVLTAKHVTVADLARMTGLRRNSIYRILRGDNEPAPKSLALICEALDIDPNEILED